MPKVDWITWKTDLEDIIHPENEEKEMEEQYQLYHTYMNSVVSEGLKHEMFYGGLDPLSLNIMGSSPAHEKAKEILRDIESIRGEYETLKKKVMESLVNQKQEEKEQLIEALDHKILEEENILKNTLALRERISLNGNEENVQKLKIDDIIEDSNNRINKLKERLDAAKLL